MFSLCDKKAEWDKTLCTLPHAEPYHSWEWSKIIERTYGYQPLYMLLDNKKKPVPVTSFFVHNLRARKITSMPFLFGAPFLGDPSAEHLWVDSLVQLAKERKAFAEIKLRHPLADGVINEFGLQGSRVSINSTLPLQATYEQQFRAYPKKRREDIRRLYNKLENAKHITFFDSVDSEDMLNFHMCEFALYQKKFGLPCHPIELFKNITLLLKRNPEFRLFGARVKNRLVAGVLFFRSGCNADYAFGATMPGFEQYGLASVLIDKGVQWAINAGCTTCNFGGSNPDDSSLLRFKTRWGCTHEDVWWYTWGRKKPVTPISPPTSLSKGYRCVPYWLISPFLRSLVRQFG